MNEEQILEQWTTQGFVTKTSLRLNVCQAFISFFLPSSSEHPSTPLFAGALGHRRARRLLSARRQGCFSSEFPTPPGGQRGLAQKNNRKRGQKGIKNQRLQKGDAASLYPLLSNWIGICQELLRHIDKLRELFPQKVNKLSNTSVRRLQPRFADRLHANYSDPELLLLENNKQCVGTGSKITIYYYYSSAFLRGAPAFLRVEVFCRLDGHGTTSTSKRPWQQQTNSLTKAATAQQASIHRLLCKTAPILSTALPIFEHQRMDWFESGAT